MIRTFSNADKQFTKVYSWMGILIVCLASIPLHFLYEWSGEMTVVSLFVPINESIWEHLKLVFWPLLLWWGFGYLIFKDQKKLSVIKWFTAAAVSILINMTFIVS